jgi:prepilin-type N-terminal cleavage/methylation domain-containing protein
MPPSLTRRPSPVRKRRLRSAFTLIELLIVIAVVAILAVVVVLVLNPSQLLKQSRDSERLSELTTLNKAIAIYQVDNGGTLGVASTTYVSIPDTSPSCTNLGLPTLPTGWNYACAPTSTYRNVNGTGWLPIDLTQISFKSPLGTLPVDPVNTTTTGSYYTYVTGSNKYELAAILESQKYASQEALDGGSDPASYEAGSDLTLAPFMHGLVGYWNFDEGGGTTVADTSGYGNTGTWNGTSTTRYVTPGKNGSSAGFFNGSSDYVDVPYNSSFAGTAASTICGWGKTTTGGAVAGIKAAHNYLSQTGGGWWNTTQPADFGYPAILNMANGQWHYTCLAYSSSDGYLRGYADGQQVWITFYGGSLGVGTNDTVLGARPQSFNVFFNGNLDDIRIYNRALSAAEIAAVYNATK